MTSRFRWTSCQLQILEKLGTESLIRTALSELPETLDETYERVLSAIDPFSRKFALRALQWLSVETETMFLDRLSDAVTFMDMEPRPPSHLLISPTMLKDICGCLITVYGDIPCEAAVEIAHYTVVEYLLSDRIKTGAAGFFSISSFSTYTTLARSAIHYLLSLDTVNFRRDGELLPQSEVQVSYPFLCTALMGWAGLVTQVDEAGGDDGISDLVLRLLDPSGSHYAAFMEQRKSISEPPYFEITPPFQEWHISPGAEQSAVLGHLSILRLFLATERFLSRNHNLMVTDYALRAKDDPTDLQAWQGGETPFEIALAKRNANLTGLFLKEDRIDLQFVSSRGLSVLGCVLWNDGFPRHFYEDVVRNLLEKGADPNLSKVVYTPLQVAIQRKRDVSIIKMLVEAGADVNGVCSDDAVVAFLVASEADDTVIERRGAAERCEYAYDTPLRIAEEVSCGSKNPNSKKIMAFLRERGAQSLHLFPGEGDSEEFRVDGNKLY